MAAICHRHIAVWSFESLPLCINKRRSGLYHPLRFLLVRRKGLEPPTYWFVVAENTFYSFLWKPAIPCISRLCGFLRFVTSCNLWRFGARLCAKCAPKNRRIQQAKRTALILFYVQNDRGFCASGMHIYYSLSRSLCIVSQLATSLQSNCLTHIAVNRVYCKCITQVNAD